MRVLLCLLVFALLLTAGGCDRPAAQQMGVTTSGEEVGTVEAALAKAKSENKPILIISYQGNPTDVDMMLLSEPSISQRSSRFVVAKVDAARDAGGLAKLRIDQHPTVVVIRANGTEVWRKKGPAPPEVTQAMDAAAAP